MGSTFIREMRVVQLFNFFKNLTTLESGIDVRQGINVGHGKFVKKNKRRALNKRRA